MKYLWLVLGILMTVETAWADAGWEDVYAQTTQNYIEQTSAEELAITALKGIQKVDKKLRLGNDGSRVTLYYDGKVIKVLRKPDDKNDAKAWGILTENIVEAAVKKSPEADSRDFEIMDILAAEMVKALDKDSKFYGSMEELNGKKHRNKRLFAARREGEFLYIKIGAFNIQTLQEFTQALAEYSDAKAMILDLKGCPGGMAGEAIKVAELILDGGIIASSKEKSPQEEIYYTAPSGDVWQGKNIFILVDAETASAAEVLASALQEQGRAKVIGTLTKGKGTMQKLINLNGESVLAVTSGFFMMPSGKELNGAGIVPDICTFEMPEGKNVANLLERQSGECGAEARENSNLEIDVVNYVTSNDIPL